MPHHTPAGLLTWAEPPQAVLFDLDGTLADTAGDLGGALNVLRVARGLAPMPLDVLRPYASAGARGLIGVGLDIRPGGGALIFSPDYSFVYERYDRGQIGATGGYNNADLDTMRHISKQGLAAYPDDVTRDRVYRLERLTSAKKPAKKTEDPPAASADDATNEVAA